MSIVFQRLCVVDGQETRGVGDYAQPMREPLLAGWSREDSGPQAGGVPPAGSKRRGKTGSLFALRNQKK